MRRRREPAIVSVLRQLRITNALMAAKTERATGRGCARILEPSIPKSAPSSVLNEQRWRELARYLRAVYVLQRARHGLPHD